MIGKKKPKLKPTLWRTTRALMNETRLLLLKLVYENDDKLSVSQLARIVHVGQPYATTALRALNARGLLGVRREHIRVFYNTQADRSLPQSLKLRDAFFDFFKTDPEPGWEGEMMILLRAYTHFNRLAIINHLAEQGPSEKLALCKAMGVCVKSIEHHLRFLKQAGVVEVIRHPHDYYLFRLVQPTDPIRRVLLELALDSEDLAHYFNDATGEEDHLRLRLDADGHKRIVEYRSK